MSELRPEKTVQKILISTTSRFVGEYETDSVLITHSWPNFAEFPSQVTLTETENPLCRNSFVLIFRTQPLESKTVDFPNYSPIGDDVCAYLSVLFGKRFDNHGLMEDLGHFRVPQFQQYSSLCNPHLPQNNHKPRKDLEIELNLAQVSRIEPLLIDEELDSDFLNFLRSAARFYHHALQAFESQPETAYLNLITCGEILSNYFEYDKDDLLDDHAKKMLAQVEQGVEKGEKIARQIKGRLLQVKRRFAKTVLRLLNGYFFTHSESQRDFAALKEADIEERVRAAYDLRSRYVHTGIEFGNCISQEVVAGSEIQVGKPMMEDGEFQKIIAKAPTYLGLERVMRYCLLRFMQLHGGIEIDARLEDGEAEQSDPVDAEPPPAA